MSVCAAVVVTDWCTHWPDLNYASCCEAHDAAYDAGGSAEDRARADAALRECVRRHRGLFMAWLMWAGVRTFGWRHWPDAMRPGRLRAFNWDDRPPTMMA